MRKGLYVRIVIDKQTMNADMIEAWFSTFTIFEPSTMILTDYKKGKSYKYNSDVFLKESLKSQLESKKSVSQLKNGEEYVSITSGSYAENITWLTLSISEETSKLMMSSLIDNIRTFVKSYKCIVGYVHSSFDQFMQNNEDMHSFEMYGGDMSKVRYKDHPIFKGEKAIDVELNPGHSHVGHGVWFGSAWLMWFGQTYFEIIPKEVITSQNYVYSNMLVEDDIVEVQLYENIEDYNLKKNRLIQQNFRDGICIDQVAHKLPKKGVYTTIDPSYEVIVEDNIKYLISYLDDEDEITTKSQSTKSVKNIVK